MIASHQTRLNVLLNNVLHDYREEHPDLDQDEARAALWDALTDLGETVPEKEDDE
jgi:hypothetical protein